jgi:hypothetical protein
MVDPVFPTDPVERTSVSLDPKRPVKTSSRPSVARLLRRLTGWKVHTQTGGDPSRPELLAPEGELAAGTVRTGGKASRSAPSSLAPLPLELALVPLAFLTLGL